jgi:DNA gyrase/topoisomerase IV subunit A
VSDRSGCGLVELALLESLDRLTAGRRPQHHVRSARALAGVDDRIGLGPKYAYQVLVDVARPWTVAVRLVSGRGNFGDRVFPDPASAAYTDSRPSRVGRLVLDAEAGRLAPVPVGLMNGSVYRGGRQPPLEPFAVMEALRLLIANPRTPDSEILEIVGGPHSVTGCEISGDVAGLLHGRPAEIRETGQISLTGVPVPPQTPELPPDPSDKHIVTGGRGRDRPRFPAHVIIESLPAEVAVSDAIEAIVSRSAYRHLRDYPELAERTGLPIADLTDESRRHGVSIQLRLSPGSDPAAVRERLREVDGVGWSSTWQFPAPVAAVVRSWMKRHRGEDLAASLAQLEQAIHEDRRQDLSSS